MLFRSNHKVVKIITPPSLVEVYTEGEAMKVSYSQRLASKTKGVL